jgi:hypothetical protein
VTERSVDFAIFGWRLGLGWLLGRRHVLLTTQDRVGNLRRSVVRYRFLAGNLYVIDDASPWVLDLDQVPRATAQAHPGPLAVRRRPPTAVEMGVLGRGHWIVLEPTGEPVPPGIEPDLIWTWGAIAVAAALAGAAGRRRTTP